MWRVSLPSRSNKMGRIVLVTGHTILKMGRFYFYFIIIIILKYLIKISHITIFPILKKDKLHMHPYNHFSYFNHLHIYPNYDFYFFLTKRPLHKTIKITLKWNTYLSVSISSISL